MAGDTTPSFDFFEYGKLFLPQRASEFQTLVASDVEFTRSGIGRKFEADVLNFPERAPFAAAVGNLSVALLHINDAQYRDRAGQYCLVQIQRRNELELLSDEERRATGAARRDFNQVRYTLLKADELENLIKSDRRYVLDLLSSEGSAAYRLADFRLGNGPGEGKPQMRPRLTPRLTSLKGEMGATEELYARAIAHELLRRHEASPTARLTPLVVLAPELNPPDPARAIEAKAVVLQRVQWLAYIRLRPITFAFDYITKREALHVLLLAAPVPDVNGGVPLADLVNRLRTQPDQSVVWLLDLDPRVRDDPVFLALAGKPDLSLAEVRRTSEVIRQGRSHPDRAQVTTTVMNALALPDLASRRNDILKFLKPDEWPDLLTARQLGNPTRLFVLDYAGRQVAWDLSQFAPYYAALPPEAAGQEAHELLARAVRASKSSLGHVPVPQRGALADSLLNLLAVAQSPPRFSDNRSILAALLAVPEMTTRLAVRLDERGDPDGRLLAACLAEIRVAARPEQLAWLVGVAARRLAPESLAALLLEWLGRLQPADAAPLIELLADYNRRRDDAFESGLLGRWRDTPDDPNGALLAERLWALVLRADPAVIEKYFFQETAHLPFEPFSQALQQLQRTFSLLPADRVQANCSTRFKRVVLRPNKRPPGPTPPADALPEFLAAKLFSYRINNPDQLAPTDVEDEIARWPAESARQRLNRLLACEPCRTAIKDISPAAARQWLEAAEQGRVLSPTLIAVLSDLRNADDGYVEYFLERVIGYNNPTGFLDKASAWYSTRSSLRLGMPMTNVLKAAHQLRGLPRPPATLNRPLLDLIGGNSDWAQWDAQPEFRADLIATLLDLSSSAADPSLRPRLSVLLEQFQDSPGRLRAHLRHAAPQAGGWAAAAAAWQERVARTIIPKDPSDRDHLSLAAQLATLPVADHAFEEKEIDWLLGRGDWSAVAPGGPPPATVARLAAVAQLDPALPGVARVNERLRALMNSPAAPPLDRLPQPHQAFLRGLIKVSPPPKDDYTPLARPTRPLPPDIEITEPPAVLPVGPSTERHPQFWSSPKSRPSSLPPEERSDEPRNWVFIVLVGVLGLVLVLLVAAFVALQILR